MMVQPRLASTVMLLRDRAGGGIEVFMVRRVVQSEFMPDVFVFPGGSVMPDDRLLEENPDMRVEVAPSAADPEGRTALGKGLRAAAIRELFEEGNVLLAYREGQLLAIGENSVPRFAGYRDALNERKSALSPIIQAERLVLATDHLGYFAHWVTPEHLPKRFDTHFFLAAAPPEQEALYDRLETSEGMWFEPADMLARSQRGEVPLAFPTFHQLRDLTAFSSVREALNATVTRYVPSHYPVLGQDEGKAAVYLPEEPDTRWHL
ncbi:MAG: NUDIX hydrolase [Chloroflexota bacterium]|nr:NUDIX hydrolase [Chloroflexota bacterium]